jgi:hypothetical protein
MRKAAVHLNVESRDPHRRNERALLACVLLD